MSKFFTNIYRIKGAMQNKGDPLDIEPGQVFVVDAIDSYQFHLRPINDIGDCFVGVSPEMLKSGFKESEFIPSTPPTCK